MAANQVFLPRSSTFVLFRRFKRLYKFNWRETSVTVGPRPGTSPFAVAIREMPDSRKRSDRILSWLIAFLAVSAAYLYTFPQANIFYAAVVLVHAAGGVLAAIFLIPMLFRLLRSGTLAARAGWLLIAVGTVIGLILLKTGTPRTEWNKLYLHMALSLAGLALLSAGKSLALTCDAGTPAVSDPGAVLVQVVVAQNVTDVLA